MCQTQQRQAVLCTVSLWWLHRDGTRLFATYFWWLGQIASWYEFTLIHFHLRVLLIWYEGMHVALFDENVGHWGRMECASLLDDLMRNLWSRKWLHIFFVALKWNRLLLFKAMITFMLYLVGGNDWVPGLVWRSVRRSYFNSYQSILFQQGAHRRSLLCVLFPWLQTVLVLAFFPSFLLWLRYLRG